jgi:nucleotidyltransferase/DNA polymerase involved in DNA repair
VSGRKIDTELLIRTVGGVTQLVGFGVTALGITSARRRWNPDMPGFLGTLGRAVDRLLRRRAPGITGHVSGVEASDSMHGRGTSSGSLSATMSLEHRVTALEDALAKQAELLDAVHQDLQRESDERQTADAVEQAERQAVDAWLDEQLVELATGDLRLETVGVCVFGLGVVLATWSAEIAQWFS